MLLHTISTTLAALTVSGSAASIGFTYPDCVNGPLKANTVCNTSVAPAARATALVAAMQNSEKLANLYK
jgi:xylan 1,4-beta-xylosidase